MISERSLLAGVAISVSCLLATGCGDATPTGATEQPIRAAVASSPRTLLPCPSAASLSASATIGRGGGVLAAGGSLLVVPAGAVRNPVELTFTVPASDIMRVDIAAKGAVHFVFERPVWVSIDYSRCPLRVVARRRIGVWYIDGHTTRLIEYMGGYTHPGRARATFSTSHLSTYALAY